MCSARALFDSLAEFARTAIGIWYMHCSFACLCLDASGCSKHVDGDISACEKKDIMVNCTRDLAGVRFQWSKHGLVLFNTFQSGGRACSYKGTYNNQRSRLLATVILEREDIF